MEYSHISPEISFLMANGKTVKFTRYRRLGEEKPSPEDCMSELTGILLSVVVDGECSIGIEDFLNLKNASKNAIVRVASLDESKSITAIGYGKLFVLDENFVNATIESGVIGYFDDKNLIIGLSQEYFFLVDSIKKMIRPNARFTFRRSFEGKLNLLILAT